jgi:hypothetical protein
MTCRGLEPRSRRSYFAVSVFVLWSVEVYPAVDWYEKHSKRIFLHLILRTGFFLQHEYSSFIGALPPACSPKTLWQPFYYLDAKTSVTFYFIANASSENQDIINFHFLTNRYFKIRDTFLDSAFFFRQNSQHNRDVLSISKSIGSSVVWPFARAVARQGVGGVRGQWHSPIVTCSTGSAGSSLCIVLPAASVLNVYCDMVGGQWYKITRDTFKELSREDGTQFTRRVDGLGRRLQNEAYVVTGLTATLHNVIFVLLEIRCESINWQTEYVFLISALT